MTGGLKSSSGIQAVMPLNTIASDNSLVLTIAPGTGTTLVTAYTCPANKIAILRSCGAFLGPSSAAAFGLIRIATTRGGVQTFIFYLFSNTTDYKTINVPLEIVLRPTDVVTYIYRNIGVTNVEAGMFSHVDEIDMPSPEYAYNT